jgi:predicted small lipoprotein YifL
MKSWHLTLTLALCAATLSCGQKGPLVLPDAPKRHATPMLPASKPRPAPNLPAADGTGAANPAPASTPPAPGTPPPAPPDLTPP